MNTPQKQMMNSIREKGTPMGYQQRQLRSGDRANIREQQHPDSLP